MDKLLKNPLVVGGALIGAYYILKKKPTYINGNNKYEKE